MSAIAPIIALAVATFISEDLACITAGELIRRGHVPLAGGIIGCLLGIYLGDLGLWALGRLVGARALQWRWVSCRMSPAHFDRLGRWFDRNIAAAVIGARFIPGTRLPVYLAAGMLQRSAARFAAWTFVAALLWTPLLVLLVARVGGALVAPFKRYVGTGAVAFIAACVLSVILLRFLGALTSSLGRAKLVAKVSRIWRWEFWPMWLFYPPVLLWIAWLTIRHRDFMSITAANPGIPHGGFVGESKSQILSSLKEPHVIATELIANARDLEHVISRPGWSFPIILKPDVGQRGAGVKLIRSLDEARQYLAGATGPTIAQPFHPGPFEAGIFYYRIPGNAHGEIFSITDKRFPEITGDGRSTIEELIWHHPRLRMQASTFLARHDNERSRVLPRGERFRLAVAGNHCQGTLFRDGRHLHTPQLERAVDSIAQTFDGFYFGRFDVRYADPERFKAGDDLTVIELNGVTSESTNIYDPTSSLFRAYATLCRQWSILFRIGAANRALGKRTSTPVSLFKDILTYLFQRKVQPLAD